MTPLRTERLTLRNWEARDRDAFFRLNADPDVMRFFGFRRSREEADALMDQRKADIGRAGIGFGAVEEQATGETIGMAGLLVTKRVPLLPRRRGRGRLASPA